MYDFKQQIHLKRLNYMIKHLIMAHEIQKEKN